MEILFSDEAVSLNSRLLDNYTMAAYTNGDTNYKDSIASLRNEYVCSHPLPTPFELLGVAVIFLDLDRISM